MSGTGDQGGAGTRPLIPEARLAQETADAVQVADLSTIVGAAAGGMGQLIENAASSLRIFGLDEPVRSAGQAVSGAGDTITQAGQRQAKDMVERAITDYQQTNKAIEDMLDALHRTTEEIMAAAEAAQAASPPGVGTSPGSPTGTSPGKGSAAQPQPSPKRPPVDRSREAAPEPEAPELTEPEPAEPEPVEPPLHLRSAEFAAAYREKADAVRTEADSRHEASLEKAVEAIRLSQERDQLSRELDAARARHVEQAMAAADEAQRVEDMRALIAEYRVDGAIAAEDGDLRTALMAERVVTSLERISEAWAERAALSQQVAEQLAAELGPLEDQVRDAEAAFDAVRSEYVELQAAADLFDSETLALEGAIAHHEEAAALAEEAQELRAQGRVEEAEEVERRADEAARAGEEAAAEAAEVRPPVPVEGTPSAPDLDEVGPEAAGSEPPAAEPQELLDDVVAAAGAIESHAGAEGIAQSADDAPNPDPVLEDPVADAVGVDGTDPAALGADSLTIDPPGADPFEPAPMEPVPDLDPVPTEAVGSADDLPEGI